MRAAVNASTATGPNPSGRCLCGCGQPTSIAVQTDRTKGYVKGLPKRFIAGHHGRLRTGWHHSAETRQKIGRANARRVWTDEMRRNVSAGNKGRKHTPEAIAKMSAAQRGKRKSEAHRLSIAASNVRTGRYVRGDGYINVWIPSDHRFAGMRGSGGSYVAEHRLVMAERLGRPLDANEVVHHVDEDRLNNEPSNLWLFPDGGSHRHYHECERAGRQLGRDMAAVPLRARIPL